MSNFSLKGKMFLNAPINGFLNLQFVMFSRYFEYIYSNVLDTRLRNAIDYKKLFLIFKAYCYVRAYNADITYKSRVNSLLDAVYMPYGFKEILAILPKNGIYILSGRVTVFFNLLQDDINLVEKSLLNGELLDAYRECALSLSRNSIKTVPYDVKSSVVSIDSFFVFKNDKVVNTAIDDTVLYSRKNDFEAHLSCVYSFVLGLTFQKDDVNSICVLTGSQYFDENVSLFDVEVFMKHIANFIYHVTIFKDYETTLSNDTSVSEDRFVKPNGSLFSKNRKSRLNKFDNFKRNYSSYKERKPILKIDDLSKSDFPIQKNFDYSSTYNVGIGNKVISKVKFKNMYELSFFLKMIKALQNNLRE